ncbi:MAG: PRC-barrel domain-containing protein [Rhodomicrobium sp.]
MKHITLTGIALLMSACPAAFAQTSVTNSAAPNGPAIQQQITDDLSKAGFTNINVVPNSFVVQAKDRSGNPITMFLSPDAFTAVSETETLSQNTEPGARGVFVNVRAQEKLASQIAGLDVYNGSNQKIGTINNIVFQGEKLKGYIVGVGGLLGLGEHDVALQPSAITLNYDQTSKKWHATSQLTTDQLKTAPDAMRADAKPSEDRVFTAVEPGDDLSSRIINISVYNKDNQNIGTLKDVAFDQNGVKAYILGVGGILGVGERYVAVQPQAVRLDYSANDRKWRGEMDASADQLKAAPQYRYESKTL